MDETKFEAEHTAHSQASFILSTIFEICGGRGVFSS